VQTKLSRSQAPFATNSVFFWQIGQNPEIVQA